MRLRIAIAQIAASAALCASIGVWAGCSSRGAVAAQPRPAAVAEPAPPKPPSQPAAPVEPRHVPPVAQPTTVPPSNYTVVSGDTLSSIAHKFYGKASKWEIIWKANKDKLPEADRLKVGMILVIPPLEEKQP